MREKGVIERRERARERETGQRIEKRFGSVLDFYLGRDYGY